MNCISHARSYISLGLLKRSSYVTFHSPWNPSSYMPAKTYIKPAGVNAFGIRLSSAQSRVNCYSSRSKAGKSGMSGAVPLVDKEKDAFFVVRKGDMIGIYKNLSDCQAQVGSSVHDPPVSVYKGYSIPKDAEEYLSSVGLKKPLYTIRASDLKEDMFGVLTPCLFQEAASCRVKVSEEQNISEIKTKDITKANKKDQLPPASMSVDPLEKLAKLEPSAETSAASSDTTCIIEFDGASKGNPGLAGAAAVLKTEDGSLICKLRQGLGIATNNAAEYRGLILGLKYAIDKGYKKIRVKGDSKLVCMQIKGLWKVKHEVLSELHKEAKELSNKCMDFEISHVLREFNPDADAQANLAVRLFEGQVQED